jgi:hypothetical protein
MAKTFVGFVGRGICKQAHRSRRRDDDSQRPGRQTWVHTPFATNPCSNRSSFVTLSLPLRHVRQRIATLIEAWQKICILGERLIRKREAAAVRSTNTRPSSFVPHLHLPPILRISSPLSVASYSEHNTGTRMPRGLPAAFSSSRDPALSLSSLSTPQADLSRLTNTLKTLAEVNGQCWKGQDCDLSEGVRQGIDVVSAHTQRQADLLEIRVCVVVLKFFP